MYLNHPTKNDVGYWWVSLPSYNKPFIVEVRWETWDHTRDGDRFEIHDDGEAIEFGNHEWYNYNFIKKVKGSGDDGIYFNWHRIFRHTYLGCF